MLSRLSVLFVYLVAGLAASAVATPMMGQSSGHGDGTKQPSRHSYAQKRPYDSGSYRNSNKACNVDKQFCCDTVNKASEKEYIDLLSLFSQASISDATSLVGKNCSPFLAFGGGKCEANPVCCNDSKFEGLVAVGCSNFNLDL